jgi:hypothetical protein
MVFEFYDLTEKVSELRNFVDRIEPRFETE